MFDWEKLQRQTSKEFVDRILSDQRIGDRNTYEFKKIKVFRTQGTVNVLATRGYLDRDDIIDLISYTYFNDDGKFLRSHMSLNDFSCFYTMAKPDQWAKENFQKWTKRWEDDAE